MKKAFLILTLAMTIIAACNIPIAPPAPKTEEEPTIRPSATPGSPTQQPASKPPDLTHHPLYCFGPLPPLSQYPGRQFIGSEDFMHLFEADAFVTAGNTGAAMVTALFRLGRIKGVDRPALAGPIPTAKGIVIFLDLGANPNCKPENLMQFGIMGSVYAERVRGVKNPRVGLVSNGEEAGKGSELAKAAYPLLAGANLNFVGNLEGKEIFGGHADVAVTDGFTGNVFLKSTEAVAKLLTLIGPGGTGKTRLSLQIAAEQLPNFKDGVWLVELAPISDSTFIVSTIATVFELREVRNVPLISILLDYLRSRYLLLILDNCEHLVESSAQIANQLLHACPNLKIIASSREALGIDGETVYRVPSLLDDEATRLFVERAMKADSRFKLTEHNASSIAQICSRLDGIPLAIELAAARVKLFTPEQIAERLDNRFKLLTGGVRTALPRQQTLRALIDWSYQTLNETEQRVLRCLTVFSGGWSFDGAESVIGRDEAMDGLVGLVNKSLVNVEEQDGASRYRFLETIRQYAMEKLVESGEAVAARDRHLDYVLSLAENFQQGVFGAENTEWLDLLEVEHDNLRAALEWAASNHLDKALKLAYDAGGFWMVRDHNSEAVAWCKTILEKTESMPDVDTDRARVYAVLGWISATTGEHKAGRDAAEKAIALAKKNADFATMARAHGILALTSIFLGDYPAAQQSAMEGEALARQHGLKSELAFALSARAQMAYFSRQDIEQAKPFLVEAADIARKEGFGWAASFLAIGLGHTAAVLGDLDTARAGFKESAEIAKRLGNKRIVYSSQSEFAHILRGRGELDEPLATYRDLLPKWKDLGHRSAVAHELECIAYILIRKEEPERAATLLGAAEALREAIDSVMTKAEQVEYAKEVSALRAGMDEVEFQQSRSKGRAMTMDEAIELATGHD